ncbi:MAG: VWA domain-containing protein, partial [Acidobacteria bacterium]|nr:VWA domain-containing protein [Acidobacteriota bacterium]
FERIPALGAAQFRALEEFAAAAGEFDLPVRNQLLGHWHSLVELIALGVQTGALDGPASARLFGEACRLSKSTDFPAGALETLRSATGQREKLDDAVPDKLLRLDPAHRAALDRVKAQLRVPSLDAGLNSGDPAAVLHALAGQVYAAWLDPSGLLVSEDPILIGKHRFVNPNYRALVAPTFPVSSLRLFSVSEGGYFTGGFAGFGELARKLPYGGATGGLAAAAPAAVAGHGAPLTFSAPALPAGDVFRVETRLVEVHATVTDERQHYADDLAQDRFQVLEEGKPQELTAFESNASSLTCAILLDVSGSMQSALPALKNAVLKLIDELRPGDSVAVYSFNEAVKLLQDFTTDRRAAKRSVLPVYP